MSRPVWGSTEALIQAASGGDLAAREEVARRYLGAVYARALRRTGDRDLAADIAQDAMVAALTALHQLRDAERFAAWLGTVVDRSAAAHLRAASSRREQPLGGSEAANRPAPACDEPEHALAERELRRVVQRALDAL